MPNTTVCRTFVSLAAICLTIIPVSALAARSLHSALPQQPPAQAVGLARPVGTIKSISGNTLTLTTDAGADVTVLVQNLTKFLRIAPGQKDLKDASPIQLQDIQPGDRILVRGKLAEDGKSVLALSIIAMKLADIAQKQAREREAWRSNGVGGLVSNVDASSNTILIALSALGEKKNVTVHVSKDTILRRYAPGSVKFDDAKPAPLDQIKPGDQLRARGTRSADGSEVTADEIVSGTFRNIAGTISSIDAAAGSITVQDLATKKAIIAKVSPESQLRKLPLPMAQRIAMRLKGTPSESAPQGAAVGAGQSPRPSGPPSGAAGGFGAGRPGGAPDMQQMIGRMPAASLADLAKGEAVMIVATESGPNGFPIVITLLGGVEPILEASPKSNASTILSPWSLGAEPSGEGATP